MIARSEANPQYNEIAVNQAVKASRQKIGKKEARLIHALLRGRDKQEKGTIG
jgi:hypothetical protein